MRLILFLIPTLLYGWDSHYRLTEETLKDFDLAPSSVPYLSLEHSLQFNVISGIKSKNVDGFLKEIEINTGFEFVDKLSEQPGRLVDTKTILAIYSDEPDWGADQELFRSDQYPQMWNEDTPYISQKTGLGSQGFRHMYFPGNWIWSEPVSSLQVPMHAIGQAPHRAELFQKLSVAFFEANIPYWGYRFLAWSLHYFQDIYQPFHARQTPSKQFIRFKWKAWIIPQLDIEKTGEQIAYYHYSFEKWMSEVFAKPTSQLSTALHGNDLFPDFVKSVSDFFIFEAAPFSASYAARLGKATHSVFAEFTPTQTRNAQNFVGSDAWRSAIQNDAESMKSMVSITQEIYATLGRVSRSLIHRTVGPAKEP